MNKHFEALVKAIADIAAADVVNLVDSKREPIADAARTLHLEHGFTPNWLRARSATEIIGACVRANRDREVHVGLIRDGMKCLGMGDSYVLWGGAAYPNRQKVADAAQYLWTNHGNHLPFYMGRTGEEIVSLADERKKNKFNIEHGYEPMTPSHGHFGVLINGELHVPSGDGWSFKPKYPDRQRVADAAQYIYDQSAYTSALLATHSGEQIIALADRVRARAKFDEAEQKAKRKMVAALTLEGWGAHGQRVKVEGIPVYSDSGPLSFDCEFVLDKANAYGIANLTGISTSFGPGAFY